MIANSIKRVEAMGPLLLACALGILLVGCSGDETSEPLAPTSMVGEFDYDSWKPQTSVHLPEISDDGFARARLESLESTRSTLDIDPSLPVPQLIRALDLNEGMQPVVDCMTQAGYPVEMSADGRGIAWTNLSDSVKTQYWICSAQYTSTAVAYPEETREQRAVKYEYYTSFFVPCAENEGVEFVGEPPTKDAWIAGLDDPNASEAHWFPDVPGEAWTPESRSLFVEGSEELKKLYENCPALPPAQGQVPLGGVAGFPSFHWV